MAVGLCDYIQLQAIAEWMNSVGWILCRLATVVSWHDTRLVKQSALIVSRRLPIGPFAAFLPTHHRSLFTSLPRLF
jgi:hypothetical protein